MWVLRQFFFVEITFYRAMSKSAAFFFLLMQVKNKTCIPQIYMFSVEYNLLVCPARILKIHHFCLSQWPKLMSAVYLLQILIGFTPRLNLAAQY